MPEEFKQIHRLESMGETVDFRKVVEEQEELENERAINEILDNATRKNKLNNDENNIKT
jgi:hypothetical protein